MSKEISSTANRPSSTQMSVNAIGAASGRYIVSRGSMDIGQKRRQELRCDRFWGKEIRTETEK